MSSHRLTPEQLAQGPKAARRSRKWFKKTLLAIFNGEIQCTATQLNALQKYADQQGWVGPKNKRQALRDVPAKPKPAVTDELLSRLTTQTHTTHSQHAANIEPSILSVSRAIDAFCRQPD